MEWTETHYTCLNIQVHTDPGKKGPPLGVTDEKMLVNQANHCSENGKSMVDQRDEGQCLGIEIVQLIQKEGMIY